MHAKPEWKCCEVNGKETEEVKVEGMKHYAKLVCKGCKHFIKWLPDPRISRIVDARNAQIELFMSKHGNELNAHMTAFLNGIKTTRFLTARQQTYLKEIFGKFHKSVEF